MEKTRMWMLSWIGYRGSRFWLVSYLLLKFDVEKFPAYQKTGQLDVTESPSPLSTLHSLSLVIQSYHSQHLHYL